MLIENNRNESALRLAARHGQKEIFEYLLEIPDVYKKKTSEDGVYDVCYYDVTEVEKVALTQWLSNPSFDDTPIELYEEPDIVKCTELRKWWKTIKLNQQQSVMESICILPLNSAIQMAKGYVVNRLIESKWSLYWFSYLVFGLFHTLIVCLVTESAVLRAKLFLEPGDISTHVENASEPVVMGVLLALYLCLTFLILLSSLIGMISNTCSNFMQDLEGQVQLQRLSISIFMEGMLPSIWKTKLKTKIKRKRYCFLKDTVKDIFCNQEPT